MGSNPRLPDAFLDLASPTIAPLPDEPTKRTATGGAHRLSPDRQARRVSSRRLCPQTAKDCLVKTSTWWLSTTVLLIATACGDVRSPSTGEPSERDSLVGAWRSQIRFSGGALVAMKDLEFMYVFNAGGTMTESSNYDAAPPVPPAYGVWKKSDPRQFDAKYTFYVTKAPGTFEDIAKGGGWSPAGFGVLTEKITLSDDGKSYRSTINYTAFDQTGKPVEGGGEGNGTGTRMGF